MNQPDLSVVKGTPTDDELVALVASLASAVGEDQDEVAPHQQSAWSTRGRSDPGSAIAAHGYRAHGVPRDSWRRSFVR